MGVDIKQVHEDEIPLLQCYAFPVCQSIQVIHLYMTQTSGREKLAGIKRATVFCLFFTGGPLIQVTLQNLNCLTTNVITASASLLYSNIL